MQHLSSDGWSDMPVGQRRVVSPSDTETSKDDLLRQQELALLYSEASSLYGLVQLLDEAPPVSNALATAFALEKLAELGSNVVRGDANAFLMIGGGDWVPRLCAMLVTTWRDGQELSADVCGIAMEAVAELALVQVDDRALVDSSDEHVQVSAPAPVAPVLRAVV